MDLLMIQHKQQPNDTDRGATSTASVPQPEI